MKRAAGILIALFSACPPAQPEPAQVEAPQLAVPERLVLPRVDLLEGVAQTSRGELVLRNLGTRASMLTVTAVSVDGSGELCLGAFVGETCERWTMPERIAAGELVRVPVEARLRASGAHRWIVRFESNDPRRPVVEVEVSTVVEDAAPCVFEAPAEVLLSGPAVVPIEHGGPGRCVLRGVELEATPAGALRFVSEPRLPPALFPGDQLLVTVERTPGVVFTSGTLRISALGTPAREIVVRPDLSRAGCLVPSASELDLGGVAADCGTRHFTVRLYNQCSGELTLDSPRWDPEPLPSAPREFFFDSSWPSGVRVLPGGSVHLDVRYRPVDVGPDSTRLVVRTGEGFETRVRLRGLGLPPEQVVERFQTDRFLRGDFILLVDTSPSFATRRAAHREVLRRVLWRASGCSDYRFAFAPADGASDGGVQFVKNDAGSSWSSTLEPDFVGRALSAFDALPTGSEVEACIGPAAQLFTSGEARAHVPWTGQCITDALEQTPQPMDELQRIIAQRDGGAFTWWTTVATSASTCAVEARDDGTHAALSSAAGGLTEDVCQPWEPLAGPPCSVRTDYFLSSRPVGTVGVNVDGQPLSADAWLYDTTYNAVRFKPESAPRDGAVIELRYARSCLR